MNFTRESVFISALRSLLKAFAVILGFGIGIIVLLIISSAMSPKLEVADRSELTIRADADWNRKLLPDTAPVLLRIGVRGVIGMQNLKAEKVKDMLLDSRIGVLSKNRVKGILLEINSPGGSAIDSRAIHDLILKYKTRYKVPVFAYVDGLCASGGFYIACSTDKIYATSDSMIGSVGVRLGPTFNFIEAMGKVGVTSLTLTEGKNKDALNPFAPRRPGDADALKTVIADEYQQFLAAVLASRKNMTKEKLVEDYGANVFIGEKAETLGYVDDGNADYDQVLRDLAKAANISEETKYQVIEIEPFQSVLKELATGKTQALKGRMRHVFPTGTYTDTDMSGQLLFLYQP